MGASFSFSNKDKANNRSTKAKAMEVIPMRDQLSMRKLGISKSGMLKLYYYFHDLDLQPDELLDTPRFLRGIGLTPSKLTIRIFDNRESLPGKHASVSFMEVRFTTTGVTSYDSCDIIICLL